MDIVSYGVASQAASGSRKTDKNILGVGVTDTHANVKERLDELDKDINEAHALADKMIVQDAVNIMKAHAKLNAIAKASKYEMHNMIFDDLLDLSGIDTAKSSGYTHDVMNGSLIANADCAIETKEEVADVIPSKAILTVTCEVEQINNVTPTMTSDNTPPPFIAKAGSYVNNNNRAYNAFNKDSTSSWVMAYGAGWIQLDFNNQIVINSYSLKCESNPWMAKQWRLEGSNNESSWVTIDSQSNQTNWSSGETRTYSFVNETPYRYYRIYVVASNGSYTQIQSIQFYHEIIGNESAIGDYFVSRDNGINWESITPDTLFYFKDSVSPLDSKIRIKAELPSGTKLANYALTWA